MTFTVQLLTTGVLSAFIEFFHHFWQQYPKAYTETNL